MIAVMPRRVHTTSMVLAAANEPREQRASGAGKLDADPREALTWSRVSRRPCPLLLPSRASRPRAACVSRVAGVGRHCELGAEQGSSEQTALAPTAEARLRLLREIGVASGDPHLALSGAPAGLRRLDQPGPGRPGLAEFDDRASASRGRKGVARKARASSMGCRDSRRVDRDLGGRRPPEGR